jgi:hypothetical protein
MYRIEFKRIEVPLAELQAQRDANFFPKQATDVIRESPEGSFCRSKDPANGASHLEKAPI